MSTNFQIFFYLIGFNMLLILITGIYLVVQDGRKRKRDAEKQDF